MGNTSGAPLLPAFWDEWTLGSLIGKKPDRTDSDYPAKLKTPQQYHLTI
jgi:hypothetical protein